LTWQSISRILSIISVLPGTQRLLGS